MRHEWKMSSPTSHAHLPAVLSQMEEQGWEIVVILPVVGALREEYATVVGRKRIKFDPSKPSDWTE